MDMSQIALVGTVALPFLGALVVIALGRWPNARESASIIVAVGTFACAIWNLPQVFNGQTVTVTLAVMSTHPELQLVLWADGLGLMFASLASFLWIITTIYSTGYMRRVEGTCADSLLCLLRSCDRGDNGCLTRGQPPKPLRFL